MGRHRCSTKNWYCVVCVCCDGVYRGQIHIHARVQAHFDVSVCRGALRVLREPIVFLCECACGHTPTDQHTVARYQSQRVARLNAAKCTMFVYKKFCLYVDRARAAKKTTTKNKQERSIRQKRNRKRRKGNAKTHTHTFGSDVCVCVTVSVCPRKRK